MKKHHAKDFPKDRLLIPRGRTNLKCKHCAGTIREDAFCDVCKKFLDDQCSTCHDEVAHDVIKIQNCNTRGGRKYADRSKRKGRTNAVQILKD